jgi:DNA-directed RNA polymerase specialized sigma24 family protein
MLLGDYHSLVGRQYQGDYTAVDVLTDLRTAVQMAGLTERQLEALRLVYGEDLTQKAAGERMGLAKQNVEAYVSKAEEKIAEIYYFWAGHNEGYAVNGGTNG